MLLSDFKIQQVVFEMRYDDAYILWDRAGRIHQDLTKLWPGTRLREGTPNQQVLRSDDVEVTTGHSISRVALFLPKTISQRVDEVTETFRIWTTELELTKFTRIGTRVIFFREFQTEEEANRAVVDLALVKYPSSPFFTHKTLPNATDLRITWQDEAIFTQVLLKSEHLEMEIPVSPYSSASKEKKVLHAMVLDIDRATRGTVELAKFRIGDWLQGVEHVINRDAPRIFQRTQS